MPGMARIVPSLSQTCASVRWNNIATGARLYSTTRPLFEIRKLCRLKIVDNTKDAESTKSSGKAARCIHVYNDRQVGYLGDKILVAVNSTKKHAIIVGCVQKQKPMVPRFDTNNIVLIDPEGSPLGNRIYTPIPSALRHIKNKEDYSKIIAIATDFF